MAPYKWIEGYIPGDSPAEHASALKRVHSKAWHKGLLLIFCTN